MAMARTLLAMAHLLLHDGSCLTFTRLLAAALAAALAEGRADVDTPLWTRPQHLVPHADDAAVDRAGHAVQHLHVELRQLEGLVAAGIADVALRRCVHHVAHLEALDRLI